jgi:iron complex outermembrane recepter protein
MIRCKRNDLLASTVIASALLLAGGKPVLAQATATAPSGDAAPLSCTPAGAPVQAGVPACAPASLSGPQSQAPGAAPPTTQEVVVTGSLLKKNLAQTDVPVTVVTSQQLDVRGITTVTNAVQSIADNGSSSLPNSFTANGAFAAGAANASLRGLTSSRTLTLIDSLRTADYPLSDDGIRNFVNLNTIPDIVIDQVQVLKDGGSATYGADAIAGVVNVITKKTFEGMDARIEGGWTEQGGASSNVFQAIIGHGNLARDGYNVYLAAEYEHDDDLYWNQRGYPFNSSNLSSICGVSNGLGSIGGNPIAAGAQVCGPNGVANGLQFNGGYEGLGATTVPVFRPVVAGAPTGNYTLYPGTGCGSLSAVTVTPAQAAVFGATGINAPTTLCQQDVRNQYEEAYPDDYRFSISARGTKEIGEHAEGYFTANFYENTVTTRNAPSSIRAQTTPGQLGETYATNGVPGITLPAVLTNGQLNPNNPFAAAGEASQIYYLFGDIPSFNTLYDRDYRLAAGVHGDFNLYGNWRWSLDLTGTEDYLNNAQGGDIYAANLLTAVANGSYNFLNPSSNSAAVRNFIAPLNTQESESKLYQIQAQLSRELFRLPGGPLTLALLGSARYESIYDPSANPDQPNAPTQKYFSINPFGVIGSRDVGAVAFEVDAPIVKQLDIDVSGRYDTYSTGQSAFSPKIDGKFTPIKYVTFRSSYGLGFRAPSFAESNSLPTTGFVTTTAPASFLAEHGGDGYGQNYSLGLTTEGTQGLKPETSYNFSAGVVLNPVRELSLSMDFYRIKVRNLIQPNSANQGLATADYYAGLPLPTGYTAIPSAGVDPNHPTLQPTLGFLEYGFVNEGVETSTGYDFGGTANFRLPYGVRYTSTFDGNYVLALNLITADGTQHYAGTLGPYNNVAAGGTPKFKAVWTNTLAYGPASVTMTANFVDGYDEEAEDIGGTAGDCLGSSQATGVPLTYLDGSTPIQCKAKPFWDFDLHAAYDLPKFDAPVIGHSAMQVYLDVLDLFGKPAPFDDNAEYNITYYNSTFDGQGFLGRTFKVGVRASFR